jgi:hypothetical protein
VQTTWNRIQKGSALLTLLAIATLTPLPTFAQYFQQGPKMQATDAVGNAHQGTVALSADGNTAIVGGRFNNDDYGAWIWVRSGGVWTQQGPKLIGSGAAREKFARQSPVAISADGNTAVVGGLGDDPANNGLTAGAVWVWVRNKGVWTQQGPKLVGSGAVSPAAQGTAVALSADGNTLIVAGALDVYLYSTEGPAWIWVRSGDVWTQQGNKLVASGVVRVVGGGGSQGASVSLSADGNTAIVGASGGGASVWIRSGTAWSQQGPILGCCGTLVALSADGNTALVGGTGAAVWTRSGGVWNQQGPTLAVSGAGGQTSQIASVDLSADGNTAILGRPADDNNAGAAWVFTRNGTVWSQQGEKLAGAGASGPARQGLSVALSADGNTAFVGGLNDKNYVGAVWAWSRNGAVWSQQGPKLVGSDAGNIRQGASVSLSADGKMAIIGGAADNGADGAAWIWARSADGWTQRTKLIGSGAEGQADQGSAVALSADGSTAIVGGPFDNGETGAVWIWTRAGENWVQQGPKLVGSGALGKARQGWSVAISADGNTAIVGGPGQDISYTASPVTPPDISSGGAAWIWRRHDGVWSQYGNKLRVSNASYRQGYSVALSAEGNTALIAGDGSPWVWMNVGGFWTPKAILGSLNAYSLGSSNVALSSDGMTALAAGSVWTSVQPGNGEVWTRGPSLLGSGADGPVRGIFVAFSADGNTAVVGEPYDHPVAFSSWNIYAFEGYVGATWIWKKSGGSWTQQGSKLVGTTTGWPSQGTSVSVSGDGNIVIVGGPTEDQSAGAVWVFTAGAGNAVPRQRVARH